jgi:LysM repeat protein
MSNPSNTLYLICLLCFITGHSFGQTPVIQFEKNDSVFVLLEGHQIVLQHKVKKGHTLYSIKRFYGVAINDLYKCNPEIQEKGLKQNQLLKIQITGRAIKRSQGRGFVDSNFINIYYRVKPKETFYGISKTNFNIPLDILQRRNKLSDLNLKVGQVLHIGWIAKTGIPDTLHRFTGLTGVLGAENNKLRKKYELDMMNGREELSQEGKACWPKDQGLGQDNTLYVLHSKAPVGSILRIENPMSERSLYAKVIGKIPDTSFARGSIVMLSPTVAYALGVLDATVYVKVYYLK